MAENGTAETVRPDDAEGAGTGVFSAPARELFAARRGDAVADPADVDAIIAQWHRVKAAEAAQKGEGTGRTALTDGIPRRLPALQTAAKAVHRARSQGRLDALLAGVHTAGISEFSPYKKPRRSPDTWLPFS